MYGSAGKPERNLSEKGEAISDFHTPRSAKVSRGWCGFLCLQQREKYMPGRLVCVDVTFYWLGCPTPVCQDKQHLRYKL